VEGDVEGLVEVLVLLEVVPVEEPGNEDQVAGRRDRQELGQPLDDAEGERLPVGELARLFADSEQREHEGDGEQPERCSVDDCTAPHRREGTGKPDCFRQVSIGPARG
jgi:hypothetical protein